MVIVTARRVVAEVVERLGEVNVELAWIGGRRRGDPLAILNRRRLLAVCTFGASIGSRQARGDVANRA